MTQPIAAVRVATSAAHRSALVRTIALALVAGLALPAAAHADTPAPADAPAADTPTDAAPPETIVVTAQRLNQTHVLHEASLGALGQQSAMATPFAIKSYDSTLILNQQPTTLGEVLENDPSVRTTYGYGNASEQYVIRGFPLYGEDIAIDGLFGITPRQLQSPELYDQVQILNGASAFLFGAAPGGSALGGTVNLEPKRAGDTPLTRMTVNYISNSQWGGSFDVSRRFGSEGEFGIRINGAGRWGDDSIDDEYRASQVLGLGADFRKGGFKLSFDLAYQREKVRNMRPMVQLAYGNTVVPVVPSDPAENYGQPWNYTTLRDVFGLLKAEYAIADVFSVYAQAGAKDSKENGNYQSIEVTNSTTGAAYETGSQIPRRDWNSAEQFGIRFNPTTGPITQKINLGVSAIQQVERAAYAFGPFGSEDGTAGFASNLTNLYHPVTVAAPDFTYFDSTYATNPQPINRIRQLSFFASDTVGAFNDMLLVTGGLRRQQIKQYSYDYFTAGLDSSYDAWATTPVVGVVLRPTKHISIYGNRIEALVQGAEVPTEYGGAVVSNGGSSFAPYTTTQYEIGGKISYPRWDASLAWYTTKQPDYVVAYAGSATAPTATVVDNGDQKNNGVEFSFNANPVTGVRLIGGFTYTTAKLHGAANAGEEGNTVGGVPDFMANLNAEYDLPFIKGVTLTGRMIHTSSEWFDATDMGKIPSWTTYGVGARYVTAYAAHPVTFRLTVDNVADKSYWASSYGSYGGQLVQGTPRTFKASVTTQF